jgi:serine/threonine protein kinase
MFGKLKLLFGPTEPSGTKPRKPVNLQRRFALLAETGRGSMSRVYRATDKTTGRIVCLKVHIREKNEAAAARAGREETKPPEGEMASKVVHPHVVRTYDWGVSTQREQFLVMEFIEGESLQLIRESKSADLARKVELMAQAAEGLAAVHAAGFIHHDVSPRNYLVDREGSVKLIDFGLAIPNTPAFRKPGNRTGTLQYMAPELIRREGIDERIDVFSFGAMAYEMLTDRLPYDASQANSMTMLLQRINTDPLDPLRADPTLPSELCDLVRKLIARRKEERWPSMANLAQTFRSLPLTRSERAGVAQPSGRARR